MTPSQYEVVTSSSSGHYNATSVGGGGGGVDIQVLQSSAATTTAANQQAIVQLDSVTVGSALEKIVENSGSVLHQHGGGGGDDGLHGISIDYGQQTLHHVNPGFHQQQQQSAIFSNDQHSHITTVVIPQPMSPVQPPASASTSMTLDSTGFQLHQTHDMSQEEGHFESLTTEQFVSQRIPVELSPAASLQGREGGMVEGPGSDEVIEDRMNYQNIPESESIPGSMSPIRGISSGAEQLAGVVFPTDKTY